MNKLLAVIFLLGLTILLVAARFGFSWAGGTGYEEPLPATVEIYVRENKSTKIITRGELIKTGSEEKAIIHIGERIMVVLDKNTDAVVEQLVPSGVEIVLRGGRLVAKTSSETEKLTISTPEGSEFINRGAVTAVRYDWLGKTEITPLDEFDWQNSADRDFIVWAAGMIGVEL